MENRIKIRATIISIACLAASAALANSVGVLGTYHVPSDGDNGYGGMLRYQWEMPSEPMQTRLFAQGGYLTGFGENGLYAEKGVSMDVDIDVAAIEFGVLQDITMTKSGALYGGLGVGYYFIDNSLSTDVDRASFPGSDSFDDSIKLGDTFGVFALAGWEHEISGKVSFFAEARYTYLDVDVDADIINSEGRRFFSESDNYDLSGFGVSVGLLRRW